MQMARLFCADKSRQDDAEDYAARFALSLLSARPEEGYWLEMSHERLELLSSAKHGAVYADFVGGAGQYRRKHGGGKSQPIVRAIGLKSVLSQLDIIDATAGLGRDALVFASLGCKVRLVERSPVVAALLFDALRLASNDAEAAPIVSLMSLLHVDALQYLSALPKQEKADVVYLDPMFPARHKKAAAKKEMQAFAQLVGYDSDSYLLLEAAIFAANNRVVVKRPRLGESLASIEPSAKIIGKSTRFDVYSAKLVYKNLRQENIKLLPDISS